MEADGIACTDRYGVRSAYADAVGDLALIGEKYGPSIGLTQAGLAPVLGSGRYFRARATMLAGQVWNNMQGIDDLDVRAGGVQ